MGRRDLSAADSLADVSPSSFSSSEVLRRRRTPALAGEGGFADSPTMDFGRYLGRADTPGRGLREADRTTPAPCGAVASADFLGCSSRGSFAVAMDKEDRRVTVLESGVMVRRDAVEGGRFASPIDARGAAGFALTALRRRELVSLVPFFATFSWSRPESLLITSAKAFPARPRE